MYLQNSEGQKLNFIGYYPQIDNKETEVRWLFLSYRANEWESLNSNLKCLIFYFTTFTAPLSISEKKIFCCLFGQGDGQMSHNEKPLCP